MRNVEVYDSRNPERLLGTMVNQPDRRPDHRYHVFAAMVPPLGSPFANYVASVDVSVRQVALEFGFRRSEDGWDQLGIYTTSASLEDLLGIREFRLPGESEHQAQHRHYFR